MDSCKVCDEFAKQPKPECAHRTPLTSGYGFGRVSGWMGIGVTYRCPDCCETLWFEDDSAEMYPEEKAHNDAKRAEPNREKWKLAVQNGETEFE